MTLRIGDDVLLADGREGQVWLDPHPEDFKVTVALGSEFATVPRTDLQVLSHQLPDHQPKGST